MCSAIVIVAVELVVCPVFALSIGRSASIDQLTLKGKRKKSKSRTAVTIDTVESFYGNGQRAMRTQWQGVVLVAAFIASLALHLSTGLPVKFTDLKMEMGSMFRLSSIMLITFSEIRFRFSIGVIYS